MAYNARGVQSLSTLYGKRDLVLANDDNTAQVATTSKT